MTDGQRLLPHHLNLEHIAHRPRANLGLVMDKFSGWREGNGNDLKLDKPKYLKAIFGNDTNVSRQVFAAGQQEAYSLCLNAHWQLIERKGRVITIVTDTPFVTGIGRSSPLENGIELHPVWGVPYWPASGIKGLIQAFSMLWMEAGTKLPDSLFGSPEAIGTLVFFDAMPEATVKIALDVLTPHQSQWASDPSNPPADWWSPIPSNFLVVPVGTKFTLGWYSRSGPLEKADDDRLLSCFTQALDWLGAGAKTAAGYGRFRLD